MASSSRQNTRICNQFARTGTCAFPNCRYAHTSAGPPPPKPPCNFFFARGHCRFGDACKFSHDTSVARPPEDPASATSLYKGWSELLGSRTSARTTRGLLSDLTADQMERFLVDAHKILEIGTSESVQQLIGDLGSERGLKRILQLVESNFALGYSPSGMGFKRHCLVFLKVVAHEEMRASLVLEKEVGTIFNFIYGPGGRRGIDFFTRVVDQLERLSGTDTREELEGALLPTATALFNTLNLNDAAAVQDQFKKIANTLITLSTRHGDSDSPFNYTYRCVQEELNRIRVLLQMADTIPSASSRMRAASRAPLQNFVRHSVDLPGELSREGPRHDNDHADIAKIKILPSSQEISSHRNEFLPQRALEYPHHLEGIARVLDFQFRLLREDTAGQIREAVRAVQDGWVELVEEGGKGKKKGKNSGVRTLLYRNAVIERIKCSQRDGLVMNATFDQPPRVQALTDKARKEWWSKSKYLQIGSLLCLVDNFKRSTFLVVCERTVNSSENKKNRPLPSNVEMEQGVQDLGSNKERAMITLRFAGTVSEDDIENVFKDVDSMEGTTQVLVEFPGLLFTSFDPVLKCLQQVSKTGNVPFPKWLAPSPVYQYASEPGSKEVDVAPPLYMTKPGVSLDLKSITTEGQPLSYSVGQEFNMGNLRQRTTLDHGQCDALIASLSRELALIQGPPGTGKSYLGIQIVKVLLDNRAKTNIGPIICVCYTNHALDQFLEHLLADGVTNIVRIGSRSKSEAVAALSLQNISQKADRTRLERYQVAKARESIQSIESSIEEACGQLLNPKDPKVLKEFLEEHHPAAFVDLFSNEPDEEGWVRKRGRRGGRSGTGEILGDWISGRGLMDPSRIPRTNRPVEALLTTSVFDMSRIEKMKLLDYWYDSMKELASSKLLKGSEDHTVERLNLTRQYQEQERRCLQESHIIGVTTTGFASHSDLIRSVNAKVLICEEAAEVLEAHILSALLPTVEHAILIGDHLQLRPQIMNHDFSMENPRGGKAYGLDTSLFERTADVETYGGKKFPVASLDTQRRMHPSIASLVRNTLYPYLIDHPDTVNHPTVKGMARRMFWMDHRVPEDGADKLELIQTSHANEFEADMVVELVRHLSRQGVYKSGEIAVLSPYLRQLFVLRRKLASMFEVVVGDRDQEQLDEEMSGDEEMQPIAVPVLVPSQQVKKGSLLNEVRVATVDNFQGEEAKIIIISLVRSNKEKKCGFLKTSNRINVLLSRAIDGMYIIGNAETCGPIDMWSKVITMFETGQNIDKRLELCCPRHRETPIFVAEADDFHLLSPEGGCSERCEWRLTCGHPCMKKCHSEVLHQSTVCLEPCNRTFQHCAHICPKPCGVACGKCEEKVRGVRLSCGHAPSSLWCHQLQELSEIRCRQRVQRRLSACGHQVMMECHQDPDVHRCSQPCGGILPCGHPCLSRCTECTRVRNQGEEGATVISVHGPCKKPCGRKYTNCPHACISSCHGGEACPPCKQRCEIRCEHSRCGKTCTEPCAPCAERCSWTCVHRERCEMPCAVPCDINPCSERCEKQLDCSHQCPSVCGERCPPAEFCQECGTEEVLGRVVDLIMFEPYSEINVDTDPIIVPTCGHFYTMETYDNIMGMKNAYEIDELGQIVGPKALDGSGGTGRGDNNGEPPDRLVMKNCPDCRSPLRDIHRYNRIVKVACLDESTRRFCTNSQANFLEIYQEVSDAQDLFQANRDEFIRRLHGAPKGRGSEGKIPPAVQERTRRTLKLGTKIQLFIGTVSEEEQPYSKVRQMAISAQRRRNAQGNFVVDSSAVQMGFRLKSQNLLLSFRWESLWDTHLVAASFPGGDTSVVLLRTRMLKELRNLHGLCSEVIEECQAARLSKYEVDARLRRAQFFALYRLESNAQSQQQQGSNIHPNVENFDENGRQEEERSLDICDALCIRLPGTVGPLKAQIDEARRLLGGIAFYTTVTAEEKRLVHLAMSAEFSSTGRWYTCANGHPFTIGNCGAPNQLTRCPECGSPIGGDHHGLAGGVNRAADFVALDDQMGRTRI